jgi:copper transport protein
VLLSAGLLAPASASGHSELTSSDPPANATLAAAPRQLVMNFSEPIDVASATVTLLTDKQVPVPRVGPLSVDASGTKATAPLPKLGPGVYTVSYQVTSATDGHVTTGIFAFLIDPSGTKAPPITPTSSASLSTGLDVVLARWLALAAVLALAGAIIFWLFSARPALVETGASGVPVPWGALALAAGASLIGLLLYLALAARPILASGGGHLAAHAGWFPLDFAGPFGWTPFAIAMRVAMLGAVASLITVVSRWLARDRATAASDRAWLLLTLVVTLVTLGGMSFAGHPAAEGGVLLALVDLAHLLGVAAWLGTLVGLFLLARRARPAVGPALRRHSGIALVAAPVVVLTGLANSPVMLGDSRELVASGYGNLLLAKAFLFSVAVAIGSVNHFLVRGARLRPSLLLIGGELAIGGLAVLAAAGLVSGQPSANRQQELALPALTTAHLYGEVGASTVHVSVDLPAPGNQRYQVGVANIKTNLPRNDVQRVFLVFTPPTGSGLAAERVQMNASDDPAFWGVTGAYTPVIGDWGVDVIVRRLGQRDEMAHFPLTVREPVPPEVVPPHDIGVGVPAPLAIAWHLLPGGVAGWLLLAGLVALAAGVAVVARRRPSAVLAASRASLIGVAVVIGVLVSSRAVVQAANQPPPSAVALANPTKPTEDSIGRGEDLYDANCSACHGAAGEGDGPTAVEQGLVMDPLPIALPGLSDGALEYRIKVGTAGSGMPGFASTLSQGERWDLVNYLRTHFAR